MTNSNISKAASGYQPGAVSGGTMNSRKTEDAQEVFAAMLGQMNVNVSQQLPEKNGLTGGKSQEIQKVSGAETKEYTSGDPARIKRAEDHGSKIQEQAETLAEEAGEEIQKVIEEEYSVTEEELEHVLEELGLNLMDLMNPANLAQVISKLTGVEDISSLLMSDGFVNVLQSVGELTADLAAQLGISQEELQGMLTQAMEQTGETPVLREENQQVELSIVSEEETADSADLEAGEDSIRLQKTGEASVEETAAETQETSEEPVVSGKTDTSGEQTGDSGEETTKNSKDNLAAARQGARTEGSSISEAGSQNLVMGQTAGAAEVPVAPVYTGTVNVSEILQQIAEFVKVSVSQNTSSLEMQLNPENLGKIFLHITASKEGSITAQFAAQNEAVKEALESQIVELKQTLNQQGVKVDAIEVTVATHEFEKNLEQNAESEKQQGQREEAQQGRKGLHSNQLDELSGLMTEEEMLAARIMQENGNSMDVTA